MPVAAEGDTVAVSVRLAPAVVVVLDDASVVDVAVVEELTVMGTLLDVLDA